LVFFSIVRTSHRVNHVFTTANTDIKAEPTITINWIATGSLIAAPAFE
jgi:hypothetical protein